MLPAVPQLTLLNHQVKSRVIAHENFAECRALMVGTVDRNEHVEIAVGLSLNGLQGLANEFCAAKHRHAS